MLVRATDWDSHPRLTAVLGKCSQTDSHSLLVRPTVVGTEICAFAVAPRVIRFCDARITWAPRYCGADSRMCAAWLVKLPAKTQAPFRARLTNTLYCRRYTKPSTELTY